MSHGLDVPCVSELLIQKSDVSNNGFGEVQRKVRLTFSRPQNLSLPSSRRGPASASSFSNGVGGIAFGSFLTLGLGLDPP